MSAHSVAVIVPTFCRIEGLKLAIHSVFAQQYAHPFEIIISDNDPSASARSIAVELRKQSPNHINVKYVHMPEPGVSNARNAALAETDAQLIASLDDDQSAPINWLSALLDHHDTYACAVTFCPISTVLPNPDIKNADYLSRFFSRSPEHKTGNIEVYYGCGSSLIDCSQMPDISPLFDAEMNNSGGEDDVLFRRVQQEGGTFGWTNATEAYEHVPLSRASINYTLRRTFSYGQGPITEARMRTPPRWDLVACWMLVGAFKATYNGALFVIKWIMNDKSRINNLDLFVQALGKVLWWKTLNFYGSSHVS